MLGTDQGRLIYPILPTVMLILVAGWAWWARGRARTWGLGGLVAGMLRPGPADADALHRPGPRPGPGRQRGRVWPPPNPSTWTGTASACWAIAWKATASNPAASWCCTSTGRRRNRIDRDLLALVQLVDKDGVFLMYADGSPTAGRDTTDRWTPGVPLASLHLLPVPDYGQPGDYRLTISLHPSGEQTWLPATGPDGAPLGEQLILPATVHIVAP